MLSIGCLPGDSFFARHQCPVIARRLSSRRHRFTHPAARTRDRAQAEAFQAAAVKALGGNPCGYKIGATSAEVQRLLNCREPIEAPIRREDVLASCANFRLPAGLLGVECEFGFVMAHDFPGSDGVLDVERLRSAVGECFTGLELVGRRVSGDVPLNEATAIADYSLDVAVVRGAPILDWEGRDLATLPVCAVVDGATVASGTGARVLGHPLNALLWLAASLSRRGERLRTGDIVFTGTCTGITKVASGQVFHGQFADLPAVEVRLT
jgi:2-keto-4-pentenoate hydratase